MKSKKYLIIFSLFLGGIIALVFPLFLSLAEEVDTSAEVLPFNAPTGLTADAVGPYQIDLNWFPAAKAVSYKVYRNGVVVGFPTATSYSDKGLNPITTYSYTVSAVNIFGGESPKSSSAPATTLSVGVAFIPPTPPEIILEPSPEHPEIPKSLIINNGDVYANSVTVTLTLSAENAFQMAISNLPDFSGSSWDPYQTQKIWSLTKEEGEKIVYAKFRSSAGGVSKVVSDTIILDTTAPTNISDFTAIPGDSRISLSWQNPPEPDFQTVKIMRSTAFYPASPTEGILVYYEKGNSFVDTGLTNGTRYYYTAFASDTIGNYSSGAIVSAIPQKPLPPAELPPEEVPPEEKPPIAPPPPEIEKLILQDFSFSQEEKKISLVEGFKIKAETEKPLVISIDYEKVPEVLKTMMIILKKGDESFSFLLRVNPEKTAYLATLIPPKSGEYSLTITTLDYKNQTLKKISGQLLVEKPAVVTVPRYKKIIDSILNWFQSIWQKIRLIFS